MESANQNTLVTGQRFEKTAQVRDIESQPEQGLFQPWYPLSEADYLRLRQSSSVPATLGGATMTFGISHIAPKLVDYYTWRMVPQATGARTAEIDSQNEGPD